MKEEYKECLNIAGERPEARRAIVVEQVLRDFDGKPRSQYETKSERAPGSIPLMRLYKESA
jgi:hypothetical protein